MLLKVLQKKDGEVLTNTTDYRIVSLVSATTCRIIVRNTERISHQVRSVSR